MSKLKKALEINRKAIDSLPDDKSEESIDRFLSQRQIIELCIEHEKEYWKNVEALKAYESSELFTIAGNRFHNSDIKFTPGMPLRLIKEPDNQFDRNAIAVYSGDDKVGYVANSERTKFELTSSASELQGRIGNVTRAEFLVYLFKPTDLNSYDIKLYIGRIIG